jgi:hypothetical protein
MQGVKWRITNYGDVSGIDDIKARLEYGPVTGAFCVHTDFQPFFSNSPQGVYRWDGTSPLIDPVNYGHEVVIVSYDNAAEYWLCKNSWGSAWGDNGYFKIGFGECLIESCMNSYVTVDQSSYAKIVPDLIASLGTATGYSHSNGEWIQVEGNVTNSAEITIPSWATLNVASGCTLSFSGDYKLIIEGKLLANGATFTRSNGQWGGIDFDYGVNGSSVSYCTIENADCGLWLDGTSPSVSNCVIQNNTTGVYATYCYSNFLWTILNNNSYGIDLASYGDPTISHNVLKYNNYAVRGDGTSVPIMGGISGYNSFRYSGYYDVYTTYSGTINAQNNYWNPWSPSTYGNVDYSNDLGSDPNTWAPKMVGTPDRQSLPPRLSKLATNRSDTLGMKELEAAYQVLLAGNPDQALVAFRSVMSEYPESFAGERALAFVDHILEKTNQDGMQSLKATIAQGPTSRVGVVAKSFLTGHLVKAGNYEDALNNAIALTTIADASISKKALYDAGTIAWRRLGDKIQGEKYLRQLVAEFPDDALSQSALATLGENVTKKSSSHPTKSLTQMPSSVSVACYPNPFNPSTTISCSLLENSSIKLEIFDVIGRKVRSLVDESRSAGYHNVVWNGRDENGSQVSSGMYLYRFTATPISGEKAFTQSGKLVLMK